MIKLAKSRDFICWKLKGTEFRRMSFSFKVFQFLCLRHHVGGDLLEPDRGRAIRTGASETHARLRNFSKIFNDF